ncbi:hypothetical protein FRC09_014165 [Ceratobasidium sp. 395]|nr:hypothetical protein FRC09_014165 [Ceratobasidium sp. 395]
MSFSGSDTVEVPSSPRRLMNFYFAELGSSSEESLSDRSLDSDDPDWMLSLEPSLLCLDLIYGFKKELYSPTNKPSAVYCKNWVEGSTWESRDGIVLSDHGSSDEADTPNSCTSGEYDSDDEDDKSQSDSHLDASEAEVDGLIQTVEDTEMLDGEEPANKSDQDTEMSDGEDYKANESMEEGEIRPTQVTSLPRSISYTDLTPKLHPIDLTTPVLVRRLLSLSLMCVRPVWLHRGIAPPPSAIYLTNDSYGLATGMGGGMAT